MPEIKEMDMNQLAERLTALNEETRTADAARLDEINSEIDAIEERKAEIKKAEEVRAKAAKAVAGGAGAPIPAAPTHAPTNMEIRNTTEYVNAFANYVKTGSDKECRALLTENAADDGSLPVPTFVGEIVAKRLEESPILNRVRRMEAAGNVKIGFEITAPAAEAHLEGSGAVSEEALVIGIVEAVPVTYKKYVSISDEALDTMSGEAYLRYIYDEVARGIIKAEENAVVTKILVAPPESTETAAGVGEYNNGGTASISDFVSARAKLNSAAEDLVIICTPAQYAGYRALQMAANYGVDPFDGLEVLFSDVATKPIIGDLSGILMNLPKGSAIEFKYDDKTLMADDMVRILGRQPAAIEVVGSMYFAKIVDNVD